jgi:hypothetical protein
MRLIRKHRAVLFFMYKMLIFHYYRWREPKVRLPLTQEAIKMIA